MYWLFSVPLVLVFVSLWAYLADINISKMPALLLFLADVTTTLDPELVQRMWHKRREYRHHGTNLGTTLPSIWSLHLWSLKRNCQLQVCSNRLQVNTSLNLRRRQRRRNVSSCQHTLFSLACSLSLLLVVTAVVVNSLHSNKHTDQS